MYLLIHCITSLIVLAYLTLLAWICCSQMHLSTTAILVNYVL